MQSTASLINYRQYLRNLAKKRRHKGKLKELKKQSKKLLFKLQPLLKPPILAFSPLLGEPLIFLKVEHYLPKILAHKKLEARLFKKGFLEKSKYLFLEPNSLCQKILPKELKTVLIPALLVDKFGNRLGFGQGYYDRYSVNCTKAIKIACVFDYQIIDSIPSFAHDIKMDYIVSNKRLLSIG